MIVLSNINPVTLQPGQSMPFDQVIFQSRNGAEFHRIGTGSVGLCASGGVYGLKFSGNIAVPTGETVGPIQLQLAASADVLPETVMISTPAAVEQFNNVSTQTLFRNGCCCGKDTITVVNSGTTPLTIGAGSSFVVGRRA